MSASGLQQSQSLVTSSITARLRLKGRSCVCKSPSHYHPSLFAPNAGVVDATTYVVEAGSELENSVMGFEGLARSLPSSSGGEIITMHTQQGEVPRTLHAAATTFLSHPTPITILAMVGVLGGFRLQQPWQPQDFLVLLVVAGWWVIQEWGIHNYLLHSSFPWLGRDIHINHHQQPYFHVSIDGLDIVAPFMVLSSGLFWLIFGGQPLFLTATIGYFVMGLAYEWVHFLVHTRWVPRAGLARRIRQHHMQHHCRSEEHWFSFLAPPIDKLLGTSPPPSTVKVTPLAKGTVQ